MRATLAFRTDPAVRKLPALAQRSASRRTLAWTLAAGAAIGLSACSVTPTVHMAVYDFGPAAVSSNAISSGNALPPLILADVEAPPAFDGTALLYRLGYHDPQQLRPYAQARWTMPPSFLLRQGLRQQLGLHRPIGSAADAGASRLPQLRVELEEFSQVFDSAAHCQALIRIRATLSQAPVFGVPAGPSPTQFAVLSAPGLIAQTTLAQQQQCASPDAAGGAQALSQASAALSLALDDWLAQALPAAGGAGSGAVQGPPLKLN